MIVIEKEVFRLYLPMDEKKFGQGSGLFSQKKCKEGIKTPRDNRAITLLIHLTKK